MVDRTVIFCLFFIKFVNSDNLMPDEKFKMISDVISLVPEQILQVIYDDNHSVELGNELTPREVRNEPKLKWITTENSYFTLLMVDPDAPSREKPIISEVKHWLVANIPGNQVDKGEIIADYFGSGPPKGTGLHRYIFLVFKQPGKINYDEPKSGSLSRDNRFNFSTKEFVKKYELGQLVAGNFFEAQWDTYVDERNAIIAEMMKQL